MAITPTTKKKKRISIDAGEMHVLATYNNTIVSFTDKNGNVLAWSSAGRMGFKGAKKSTPYAAGMVVRSLVEQLKDSGLREVDVYLKGIGSGRDAAVRALASQGVSVGAIKDLTPLPHNGVRPKKPRRV